MVARRVHDVRSPPAVSSFFRSAICIARPNLGALLDLGGVLDQVTILCLALSRMVELKCGVPKIYTAK